MSDRRRGAWRLATVDAPRILSDSHGNNGVPDVPGVVCGGP